MGPGAEGRCDRSALPPSPVPGGLAALELIDLVAWRPARPFLQGLPRRPLPPLCLSFLLTITGGRWR